MPALATPEAFAEPSEFDRALLLELRALKDLDPDALFLRHRVLEIQNQERQGEIAADLRHEVLNDIEQLEVPALGSLRLGSPMQPGLTSSELKRLATALYTEDAMPLIQQFILGIIEPWDHLVRDFTLQLSLFQVGQVYGMSALFGYAVRQAELRFGLERAAGVDGKASTLSQYVTSLDSQEVLLLSSGMSLESQHAIEQQVTELFGDPETLWQRLVDAVRPTSGSKEELTRLRQAVADGKVESASVTVASLRHLALEGVAFGFLLSKAEDGASQVLTYTESSEPPMLLGAASSAWGIVGRVDGKRSE